jgi:hypothetical protein
MIRARMGKLRRELEQVRRPARCTASGGAGRRGR